MEKLKSIYEIPFNISDETFDEFQSMITPEKIFEFSNESKVYTEKSKFNESSHKINKQNFIFICQKIFQSSKNTNFNGIYDLIFERFKEKKCVFTTNISQSPKIYSLSYIISTEKIELYVVELFFCCIMQSQFKKKIETMFYISDLDDDGLINEREIKRIILTTNKLFCEESSEYFSDSTLIQQSLSSLKAKKALHKLLYSQGELEKKFLICKYISFDEFYDSLIKIENYKYDVIPTFINLKKCLLTKRNEIEFDMNKKCKKDFLKISYELINKNNNLNNIRNILKKCFDKKIIKKKMKIDPLKEIKEKKEKEREKKLKRMIQIKKKEYMEKIPYKTNSSFYKNKIISFSEGKSKEINNNYNDYIIKYNSESKNSNNLLSKFISVEELDIHNNIKEDINQTFYNRFYSLKKIKSLDNNNKDNYFQEQLNLIKRKSINPNTTFKSLIIKKKGILRSSSNISPLNQTDLNKNNNLNKFVSFSDNNEMKHCLSHQNLQEITTSNFNIDTNNSTSAKKSSIKSEEINISNINFKKIPLIKMFEKNKNNKTKKILFKNNKNIKETNSNNISIISNNNKNKLLLSRRNTVLKDEYFNNKKYFEKGDYYKFDSIVFPPCIITDKEKNNNSFFNKKGALIDRIIKNNYKKLKKDEIDQYDCLLKTFDEVKGEVFNELEQQKNINVHGLITILKIGKNIEEIKNNLPIADLNKNQVEQKTVLNHKNGN